MERTGASKVKWDDQVPVIQSNTEIIFMWATRSFVKKSMKQGKRRAVEMTRELRMRAHACLIAFSLSSLFSRMTYVL